MRSILLPLLLSLFSFSAFAVDDAAVRYYNLAVQSLQAGQYEQAMRDIDRALILEPNQAKYHYIKGNAALASRRYSTAEDAYRKAVKLDEDFLEAHEGLGKALFRQGKLSGAKIAFEKARLLGTSNAEPSLYLGMIAFKNGKLNEAERLLKDATRRNQKLLEAHLTLGEIALKKKKGSEAKEHFSDAVALDPKSERAHRRLGEIAYRAQEWGEAVDHLRKALSMAPSDHLRYLLGKALYENQDYKAAVVPLESLKRKPKYRNRVYPLLGLIYVETGRLSAADRAFREVLKSDPKNADALRGQAKIALKQGKKKLAESRLKKALDMIPNDPHLRFDLGKLLYDQRRYKEAAPQFSQAARLGLNPSGMLYLARTYKRLDRTSQSLQSYQRLLKKWPNHLEANWELGIIYFKGRKWKMAIGKFERVVGRMNNAEIYAALGRSHYELKNYDDAANYFAKAVRAKEDEAENHYWLGMAYWRQGKENQAFSAMDEAVRRNPKNWESRMVLGILHYNKGQTSDAETHLRRAVQLNGGAVQARYHLGRIYMDRNQPKLAVPELKRVVKDDPKHTEASQLLGDAYSKLGMKDQALDAYGQSIQLGKASEFSKAKKKIDYGKLMLEQGQPEEAIKEYQKEIRKKPKSIRAWTGLGRAYAELNQNKKSDRAFRRALTYSPRDEMALYYYGEFLRDSGKTKQARSYWKRYLQAHPQGIFAEKLRNTLR